MRRNTKYYRLNYQIAASRIRLIDDTGKQIGVVSKVEALKRAQAEDKDLVEIAPNADPPVVKLIDFKKFKYLEAKKEKEARKNVKRVEFKEIRLSPFMGEHDFKIKVNQGEKFLREGNQLKLSLPFKGRTIAHIGFGRQVLEKAINHLQTIGKVVKPPYLEGRILTAILIPTKRTTKLKDAEGKN